jgi:hypothetical protein
VTYLAVIAIVELALIAYLVFERRKTGGDFIALVDRLCQRIQAPGAAALEHDEAVRARRHPEYAPPALEPEDDEAYWMSREKLAEAMMEAERVERAG